MIIEINIYNKFSGSLCLLTKEINDNYMDVEYTVKKIFNRELTFNISKSRYEENNNVIIGNCKLNGVAGYLADRNYFTTFGINLANIDIDVADLKSYLNSFKAEGFKVIFNELFIQEDIKINNHELSRTKFQKFFNLNKYKG